MYLPVVPLPPQDNFVKWYMDNIVQIMEEIETEEIFVHADKAIIVKLLWSCGFTMTSTKMSFL